ncbi:sigma-70 family RNA polymerase sigma factor [Actinomadura sp. NPDC048394]|jgi:RNA polymerase sigma-70 factor (ECF subfamily)|uniref:RNA polymerase sigma factor n=1 Tax=Actinomadura sp. NPDC048394 TaxID=3158223 RepID=UPI0034060379
MDKEEFAAVYATTYRALLGYALRRCDTPEDAADVVAETFAIAWRRAADVPSGDGARLWLYGVARRVLANHRRGLRRHADKTAALRAELTAPVHDDSPVTEVFRALPDRDRELLTLVAWEGLSVPEIAAVLGCSRNAVSIRLHRARKRFARALRAAGVDQPGPGRPVLRSELA